MQVINQEANTAKLEIFVDHVLARTHLFAAGNITIEGNITELSFTVADLQVATSLILNWLADIYIKLQPPVVLPNIFSTKIKHKNNGKIEKIIEVDVDIFSAEWDDATDLITVPIMPGTFVMSFWSYNELVLSFNQFIRYIELYSV